jgi:hypothetical protein
VISTGLMGLLIGAIVLAQFKRSERARKDIAKRAVDSSHTSSAGLYVREPAEDLAPTILPKSGTAGRNFGGYLRSNVLELEGRYVCFRPAFTLTGVISAYLMVLRWDDAESCLTFEEEGRADAGHTQRGRVYIPDGRPFISFVTVERGAIRLITVSRPEKQEPGRGLIMTLSNPSGMQFTPASAPVVLRRVENNVTQLGFIPPGAPDYDAYRRELETVIPAFGFFATSPGSGPGTERLAKTAGDARLSIAR